MADVKHVDKAEFEALVQAGGVVLVDFYADWCMPCKMMAPAVEQVSAAFDGRVAVAKVNVDDEPELAAQYGIQSIPALFVLKDGAVASQLIGVRPYEELAAAVEAAL